MKFETFVGIRTPIEVCFQCTRERRDSNPLLDLNQISDPHPIKNQLSDVRFLTIVDRYLKTVKTGLV
jgi:hypothetical protein